MTTKHSSYKEQGIVLHSTKFSERKLIVYILTQEHGRCNYIVSVSRAASRNLFQPLSPIEFIATPSSTPDGLHSMREATLSSNIRSETSSPLKSMIVMTLSEILYRVVKESDENIFHFTFAAIQSLNTLHDNTAIANFHLHFLVHFTSLLGYAPSNEWHEGCFFDIKESEYCATQPRHLLFMPPHLSSLLNILSHLNAQELYTIKLNGDIRRQFLNSLIDYYGYHNDAIYSVNSISILSEIL